MMPHPPSPGLIVAVLTTPVKGLRPSADQRLTASRERTPRPSTPTRETMSIRNTLAFVTLALAAGFALAAEPKAFTQSAFDQLAHDGKPVIVDVAASWCPTCRAQKPIVEGLTRQGAYQDVTVLTVDFDTSKPVLKAFRVGSQSTLIAFKGGKETGRSVGDTTPASIEALFKKAAN
jgi:thiol-disulfide isomerase/thioredoxin